MDKQNEFNGALILEDGTIFYTDVSYSHSKLLEDLKSRKIFSKNKKSFDNYIKRCVRITHFNNQVGIEYFNIDIISKLKDAIYVACKKLTCSQKFIEINYILEKSDSVEYQQFNSLHELINYIDKM